MTARFLPALFILVSANAAFAQTPETQRHKAAVEAGLLPPIVVAGGAHAAKTGSTLAERMAALHVPGVSIAVIHSGVVEWVQGYGVGSLGGAPVTPDTLFQAGSISKPVSALAALKLVEQHKLSLDADINTELRSWKLPTASIQNGKPVTLRELLTHTAGITVHGFPGYAAGAPVPTLVQVLNGEAPANTSAIRSETEPGTKWNYSGGGITIMQQAMIDVSGRPFPKLLHDTVLAPLNMTHSTFEQPLPTSLTPLAATPYLGAGLPIPGGAHTYPEMAAAGLWTTAGDLARFAIEVQKSLHGQANHVLSQAMTQGMLTPGMGDWGLGVQIGGAPGHRYFTHGGVDAGFESEFVEYEDSGDGAVILTNAQGGTRLCDEILRSVAAEYGWPDFQPVTRTAIKLDPKLLPAFVGTYSLVPGVDVGIMLEDGTLYAQLTGQPRFKLTPESPNEFFLTVVDAQVEFTRDADGHVNALILHQNGHDTKAPRK